MHPMTKDVGVSLQVFPVALCFYPAAVLHLKTKSASIFHSLFDLGFYDNEILAIENSIQIIQTDFGTC
jgi:hypothetical protein